MHPPARIQVCPATPRRFPMWPERRDGSSYSVMPVQTGRKRLVPSIHVKDVRVTMDSPVKPENDRLKNPSRKYFFAASFPVSLFFSRLHISTPSGAPVFCPISALLLRLSLNNAGSFVGPGPPGAGVPRVSRNCLGIVSFLSRNCLAFVSFLYRFCPALVSVFQAIIVIFRNVI